MPSTGCSQGRPDGKLGRKRFRGAIDGHLEDGMPLNRLVIYTKDVEETARFYETYFGFEVSQSPGDRIVELIARDGGADIMLHPAAKGQRTGQSLVKLVFDVEDVAAFCALCSRAGLAFGPIHEADGYQFANARDPGQNPIQVSSRAFRTGR